MPGLSIRAVCYRGAAALVVGTVVASCGAAKVVPPAPARPTLSPLLKGDPNAAVTGSPARTTAAGNATLGLQVPVFSENKLTTAVGQGAIDFAGSKLKLTLPDADAAEERQFGTTLYVRLPGLTSPATPALAGKQWIKSDPSSVPKGPDPFTLTAYDPAQLLQALGGASNVSLVGLEDITGTPVGHFHATIEPATAQSAGLDPAFAQQLKKASGGTPLATDVWLSNEGLVRRMSVLLPPPGATALPAGSTPTAQVDFSDFGKADTTFTPPPADEVADAAALNTVNGTGD